MTKHGMSSTQVYKLWAEMRRRCENPKSHTWPDYGGRGIKCCERWRTFENFLADMGPRPPGMTLDRKDNSGDYELANCRWATPFEQGRNKRNNTRYQAFGESKTCGEWAEDPRCTVAADSMKSRIYRGWSIEKAITEPPFDRGQERAVERRLFAELRAA